MNQLLRLSVACLWLLLGYTVSTAQGQDVIRASGGTDLSVDKMTTGEFASISGPTVRETSSGQLEEGETIILALPSGYIWNDNLTDEDIEITIEPVGTQNTGLDVSLQSISASEVVLTVTSESSTAGAGQGPGRFTLGGLELRPDSPDVPNEGEIRNTGTTAPSGETNYGNLSTVAGGVDEVRVETAADGSGDLVPEQTLLAGQSIEVFAVARDAVGNFIENISLDDESNWSLIEQSGDISSGALDANLSSATFMSEQTGTVRIRAAYSGVNDTPSGTITVDPRPATSMEVETEPSTTATAGEPFDTQPVLQLYDSFGNLVTTDNETTIEASLESGSGTLLGSTTSQAESGVVNFSGLFVEESGTVTLRFESDELSRVVSGEITIEPAAPEDLEWVEQPSNTSPNNSITPPPEVQLLDAFGNQVEQEGVLVEITEAELEGEPDGYLEGTLSVQTGSNGVATFEDLDIADGTNEGVARLSAGFPGILADVESDDFLILDATDLAGFVIFPAGEPSDTPLPDTEAGTPFEITIRAVDGNGDTFTGFEGSVEISSESEFGQGEGETAPFEDGELTAHTIELESAGEVRIYAENTEEDRSSRSNRFNVLPSDADALEAIIESDLDAITADGESRAEITVQLRDRFGNELTDGGDEVEIQTSAGTLSTSGDEGVSSLMAEDLGDGRYRAELTSGTDIETADVEAWLGEEAAGGEQIGELQIDFLPGSIADIRFILPEDEGSPADQTAGVPFEVSFEALDENGNLATGFSGELELTSTSSITEGETVTLTDGVATAHTLSLSESGDEVTITATDESNTGQSGTSDPFRVLPAGPDGSTSTVTANPGLLQNDGSSESVITVILRDQFGNRVLDDHSVTITAEQLEEDNVETGGTEPVASIGQVEFIEEDAIYRATITSSTTIELVEITGAYDGGGSTIDERATVNIVLPNTWEPSGDPQQRVNWQRPENWSLGTVPGSEDFVIIPSDVNDYPDVIENVTIGSLQIEEGADLNLLAEVGEPDFTILGQGEINGTFDIEDNTSLTVGGNFLGSGTFAGSQGVSVDLSGQVSISSFLVRTSDAVIRFNGDEQQTLSSDVFLAENLEILNDVRVTNGDLIDTANLTVAEDVQLELIQDAEVTLDVQTEITGSGTLQLNNNTLVLGGSTQLENVDAGQATVVFGVRPGEDPAEAEFLSKQQIFNLSEMLNVTVNNDRGVRTYDDILVEGTLTLENGELIIGSGRNLIAPEQIYENGFLTFRRSINTVRGWRMMSSPVSADYGDLFDGLVTQGVEGSTYPDETSHQPNLLWYDETHPGTDLQRWRTPESMNDQIETGRGYFFYVFGDVEESDDYNDDLPTTLSVSGQENQPENGQFDFNVTYTAEADTGWNLVGNPFGSTIDWDDDSNWVKEHMDNVLYIWDPDAGEYKTWNGVAGSFGSGNVAPFQAFWVKASVDDPEEDSPSLQVSQGARSTGGHFLQSYESPRNREESYRLELVLQAGEMETTTSFSFTEDGKLGKDRKDAWYLQPMPDTNSYLMFYSLSREDDPMAIQNLPKRSREPYRIELGAGGFLDGEPVHGDYRVSIGSESSVPADWEITLTDRRTGETVDLQSIDELQTQINEFRPPAGDLGRPEVGDLYRLQPVPLRLSATTTGSQETGESGESYSLSASTSSGDNLEHPFVLTVTPDDVDGDDVPEQLYLRQNYPNPFNNSTTIEYGIPEEYDGERVELVIFNILGQRIETLVNESREKGYHSLEWNASGYASGVYLYRLRVQGDIRTGKMTFIK